MGKERAYALRWEGDLPGHVSMLDQTLLPNAERYLQIKSIDAMVDAIRALVVRGAPAIGIAGAYGVLLGVQDARPTSGEDAVGRTREAAAWLARARPTAVNLPWALNRMVACAERELSRDGGANEILAALLEEARAIHTEDADQCQRMGDVGVAYLAKGMTVLTHCHAGAVATGGIGTALAPIHAAHAKGLNVRVIADETRPLLQGARITAWELDRAGIDVTLIVDGAMAGTMASGTVDAVMVGADRIASNGDVCNKVGTYGVAVLAHRHGVPFYVVAPASTFDREAKTGADIRIEERDPDEVRSFRGIESAPTGVSVHNPAFDITPAELVTAIITPHGAIERPDAAGIARVLAWA